MASFHPSSSPAPTLVSLLPLILSPASFTLPNSLLSTSVLQRHHFLRPTSSASYSYLQSTSDVEKSGKVESIREKLAEQWLEEVQLQRALYSATVEENGRVVASVQAGYSDHDNVLATALCIQLVWEEARQENTKKNTSKQVEGAESVSEQGDVGGMAEGLVEAAWRYYDLQLPSSLDKGSWFETVEEAIHARDAFVQMRSTSFERLSTDQDQDDYNEENQNEENDFWAGVVDDDDDKDEKREQVNRVNADSLEGNDREDRLYWSSFGEQEVAIDDVDPSQAEQSRILDIPAPKPISSVDSTYSTIKANASKISKDDESDKAVKLALRGIWQLYLKSNSNGAISDARRDFLQFAEQVAIDEQRNT